MMSRPCLIDTNVLVYAYDPRDPNKQEGAQQVLRELLAQDRARLAHQSVVEFVAATTRVHKRTNFQLLTTTAA
ncbi:MAG: PIN domain-containing protein, partial [Polyangiales bacterium]